MPIQELFIRAHRARVRLISFPRPRWHVCSRSNDFPLYGVRATEPKHSRNNRTRKNETGDQGSICRHLIVCPEWARSTRINKCQGSLRYPFYLPRASFPLFFNPLGEKGKRIYTLGGENLSAAVVDTICVYIFFLLKEKKLGKFIFIIFVAIKIFLLCRNNSSLTNSR